MEDFFTRTHFTIDSEVSIDDFFIFEDTFGYVSILFIDVKEMFVLQDKIIVDCITHDFQFPNTCFNYSVFENYINNYN